MSDLDNTLMPQVFTVDDDVEEFDVDLPPTSGQEYLRRVQLEAQKCPAVVVAEMEEECSDRYPSVKLYTLSGLQPAPKGYAPSIEWQRQQVATFSEVRQKMAKYKKSNAIKKSSHKLPLMEDAEKWCKLCFGSLLPRQPDEETEDRGQPPLLSIIAYMNQPTILKVLEYHVNWFEATGFTKHQGQWFYALSVCLEKPLEPEACSLLRSLARNCANLRATLESKDDEKLVQLNLLICLVARYFDQLDLADSELAAT